MPTYDGVVTLDESDVPVVVELADDYVRLSASGTEIGQWSTGECHIDQVADKIYTINAENETLQFVPNQPSLFAAAVSSGREVPMAEPTVAKPEETSSQTAGPAIGDGEAPPPKTLTLVGFYLICAATAALALWSMVTLFS